MLVFLSKSDWCAVTHSYVPYLSSGLLCSDCVHVFGYVVRDEYSVCLYAEWLRSNRESWSISNFSTIVIWLSLHIDCYLSLSRRCGLLRGETQAPWQADRLLENFHRGKLGFVIVWLLLYHTTIQIQLRSCFVLFPNQRWNLFWDPFVAKQIVI